MTYPASRLVGGSARAQAENSARLALPGGWLGWTIAAAALLVLALVQHNRQVIEPRDPGFVALVVSLLSFALLRHATRGAVAGWALRGRDLAEHALALIAMCVVGGVASYAMAAETHGFIDGALARSDRMLHFDWLQWYAVVAHNPLLQRLGAFVYGTIWVSPWVLILYLAYTGEKARARQFLLSFWTAIVLTLVLFPLFPAKGALDYLWHGPIPYMPTNGLYQGELIPLLRAHQLSAIDLGSLKGLVCAPSFHTASATVFITSAWPLRRLRWFLVPLNCAMLLATPVEGTHYLSDMIMGLGVALVAIAISRALTARFGAAPEALPLDEDELAPLAPWSPATTA